MNRSLQALYENGVLRPLEPLALAERQQVTVTVTDHEERDWNDTSFLTCLREVADDSISLEQVRAALAKIPGSMAEEFRRDWDERR